MDVVGHSIDIVAVSEMQRWIDDPRDPLIPRCFVQAELDEIGGRGDRIERLAGRFAAKEAVLKAIGTGFGAGIAFTDVMIHRVPGAAPEVRLLGGAAKAAMASGMTAWRLSITHARWHRDGERSRVDCGGAFPGQLARWPPPCSGCARQTQRSARQRADWTNRAAMPTLTPADFS